MSKALDGNMREFLNYINEDEIGLFVMTIDGTEDVVNIESLIGVANDIKGLCIDKFKGVILGKLFGSDIEISVI